MSSLAIRDQHVVHIRAEIQRRKQMLRNKQLELAEKQTWNEFLEGVRDDYTTYHQALVREKQQQYDALLMLKDYMSDLVATNQVMDKQLDTAQRDQQTILRELGKVKTELDELVG